jgi:hypothetical protein
VVRFHTRALPIAATTVLLAATTGACGAGSSSFCSVLRRAHVGLTSPKVDDQIAALDAIVAQLQPRDRAEVSALREYIVVADHPQGYSSEALAVIVRRYFTAATSLDHRLRTECHVVLKGKPPSFPSPQPPSRVTTTTSPLGATP